MYFISPQPNISLSLVLSSLGSYQLLYIILKISILQTLFFYLYLSFHLIHMHPDLQIPSSTVPLVFFIPHKNTHKIIPRNIIKEILLYE